MSAIINDLHLLLFAEGGGASSFYDQYLNIPGFEAWKFINLALFIGLGIYLLRTPLGAAFKAKRESIRAELIKAEQEKQEALARMTAAEAQLAQIESEKAAILNRAKSEAEDDRKRLIDEMDLEIRRLRSQADAEIARLAQLARVELKRLSAEESIRRAEEKLRTRMDADSDSRLVKASIQEIGGLN
jgi:F-type H+-transporting ATPase subunit b